MTKKEGVQALLDGRRFKDKKGNIYGWKDDTTYQSPFRVYAKDLSNSKAGLQYFWDVLDELTEVFEIPDLDTDTKVLVSDWCDRPDQWLPRHFKGWTNNDFIITFDGGQTSHTANPESTATNWKYWKIDEGKYEGRQNF